MKRGWLVVWVFALALGCGGASLPAQPVVAFEVSAEPVHATRPEGVRLAAAMRALCTLVGSTVMGPDGLPDTSPQSAAQLESIRAEHEAVLDDLDRDPRMHGRVSYATLVTVLGERGVAFDCPAMDRMLRAMAAARPSAPPALPSNNRAY